jgi:hypothetical protein
LFDAVILIAATAGGFALLRPALENLKDLGANVTGDRGLAGIASSLFYGLLYAPPLLMAWSIATLAISLRQPRPPLRMLARSPGFVMNIAVVVALLLVFADSLMPTATNPSGYMHILTLDVPSAVRNSVIGSIVSLAFFRSFWPRPVWTDRLGWALGLFWVVIALLSWPRAHFFLFSP